MCVILMTNIKYQITYYTNKGVEMLPNFIQLV